ncbi:MAG: 3'(2'),5'-bisphosphate nucleotidase [Phycisphaerae bacterium]|nr:3'(2'),5'-bisphosphate nucleotidase [Phycisphaerae bacterium]
MPENTTLAQAALLAVAEASLAVRAIQDRMSQADRRGMTKDDESPVTVGDYAAQALVARSLTAQLGPITLVGEESAEHLRRPEHAAHVAQAVEAVRHAWPEADADSLLRSIETGMGEPRDQGFWTLDPIDGTKGFLRGEQFCVCLAYIERGRPAVGVLGCPRLPADPAAPIRGDERTGSLYLAVRDGGAWEISGLDPNGPRRRLPRRDTEVVRSVRTTRSVERAHGDHSRAARVLAALGPEGPPVMIDSQCKYAVVARGQADTYLRFPSRPGYHERIWDHAPGALLVSEAGCAVSDARGVPLDFGAGRGLDRNWGIVAAPPELHRRTLRQIELLGT